MTRERYQELIGTLSPIAQKRELCGDLRGAEEVHEQINGMIDAMREEQE